VRTLREWPLLAAIDVPPLTVSVVPCVAQRSRAGELSLSEVAGGAALAAIANAVSRAAGRNLRELPLVPAVVLGPA
jgi:CO/xanthine dehydrogenase Mo-binding subunit